MTRLLTAYLIGALWFATAIHDFEAQKMDGENANAITRVVMSAIWPVSLWAMAKIVIENRRADNPNAATQ